jgi:hypothetical protein
MGRKRWNNKENLYENKYNNRQIKKKGHGGKFHAKQPKVDNSSAGPNWYSWLMTGPVSMSRTIRVSGPVLQESMLTIITSKRS